MIMKANITVMHMGMDWETYTVNSAEDCRDEIDRMAYEMAVKLGDTVQMGCVCVDFNTPVIDDDLLSAFETLEI